MGRALLVLHDQAVAVSYPDGFSRDIDTIFAAVGRAGLLPHVQIDIRDDGAGRFSLTGGGAPEAGLTRDDVLNLLMERVLHALIADLVSAPVLHAGAVLGHGAAVLVAGATGAGKTSLVAWLLTRGYHYLTDEIVVVVDNEARVVALPRALVAKAGNEAMLADLPVLRGAATARLGENLAIAPPAAVIASQQPLHCGLIIMPTFVAGSDIRIESLSAAHAAFRLMACNLNARNLGDGGLGALAALSRAAPCITLQYGHYDQLAGALDTLARLVIENRFDAGAARRLLAAFAGSPPQPVVVQPRLYPIPLPTPRRPDRKLTIGMATYDDYDGVYFSLQALRLFHPEIVADAEFLVVDNHPDGPCSAPLKALEQHIPSYRYVPLNARVGTAVRDRIFHEAAGALVLCMDCHVMFPPGTIRRLLDYFERHPDTGDLLQGPMIHDDLSKVSTHFKPGWRAGMYGFWEADERGRDPDGEPFDIPMQGLGVFACRRDAWLGFNPRFRGFGGEEGYIHEKFRRAGRRVLCLPFLRWLHRFQRPMGPPYRISWEDRIHNYVVGFREVGLPIVEMEAHFREMLGVEPANRILAAVAEELSEAANAER